VVFGYEENISFQVKKKIKEKITIIIIVVIIIVNQLFLSREKNQVAM